MSESCAELNVDLLHVYIREAHPRDEWSMEVKPGVTYLQPKVLSERLAIANSFAEDLGIKDQMVVDDIANPCDVAYEARPERLYVLDGGVIVWRSGLGPFQYDVEGMRGFISSRLASA